MRASPIDNAVVRFAICTVAISAITAVLKVLPLSDRPLTTALLFLFLVLVISVTWGLRYALFTAILAGMAFAWLVPRRQTFWISDGRDVFALTAFLVMGTVGSYLSDRARKEAISARQRQAEAVAARQQFADLMNSVEGIVWEADAQTFQFLFVSRQAERILGYPVERWLNEPAFWKDHLHPDDRDWAVNFCVTLTAQKTNHDFEYRMIAADGRSVWLRDIVTVVVEGDRAAKLRGVMIDIAERKRAEALLAGEKHIHEMVTRGASLPQILDSLCRLVEEQAPDVLASILLVEDDHLRHGGAPSLPTEYTEAIDGVMIGPNVGSCGTAAYLAEQVIVTDIASDPLWADYREAALPHSLRACWSTPIFSSDDTVIATFAMYYREPRSPSANDQEIIEQITHLAGIAIQRKLGEAALQEVQAELAHITRVATMGELTSSIAHEVNQPLAAIVTNGNAGLRWLAAEPPNLEEVRLAVERMIKEGNRASEVIKRIRALVKKAPPQKERLDINEVIHEVLALAHSEAQRQGVTLRTRLPMKIPPVQGDRVQLQQVLLNLIINGIEATSGGRGGPRELLVRTERVEAGGVRVAVEDTGIGLEPESVDRLFDAFYTTKSGGMGMGLAISRSIIEAHGGRLWASPNHPRGAVIQFTLPQEGD